jgi:hypothetical protein
MTKMIRAMRVHRFGGPNVLQGDEIEVSLPDALQVLVTVRAASVNPVDYKLRSGKYPAIKEDRLPCTLERDVPASSNNSSGAIALVWKFILNRPCLTVSRGFGMQPSTR